MESTLNSFITRSEYEEVHPQIASEYAESQPPQEKKGSFQDLLVLIVTEEKSGWIWLPVPAHCYK